MADSVSERSTDQGDAQPRRKRLGRRGAAVAAVGVSVVVLAGVVLGTSGGGSGDAKADSPTTSSATTTIRRQDLVEVSSEDGTLGYSDERDVISRLSGTVTWVPGAGELVHPDHALYKVDGESVILMNGRQPAYRTLSPSVSEGKDVRQLERNLRVLGYDSDKAMKVDGTWTSATTDAVLRWQKAHGLSQDGSIELGQIVFQPGTRRVAQIKVSVGSSASGGSADASAAGSDTTAAADSSGAAASSESTSSPSNTILTTTSRRKVVTVDLETTKSSLAKPGARVAVKLPSGSTARGRITDVGQVATAETSDSGETTGKATIKVTIRLFSRGSALDQAPVTVRFENSRVKDVLAIPVTALLARPGGKFAVQIVDGTSRRLVTVTPGLYTSGFVQIDGPDLKAGMTVTNSAVE